MATAGGLTEDQKRRMEENRKRAMEKRAARLAQQQSGNQNSKTNSSRLWRPSCISNSFASDSASKDASTNAIKPSDSGRPTHAQSVSTSASAPTAGNIGQAGVQSRSASQNGLACPSSSGGQPYGQRSITQFYSSTGSKSGTTKSVANNAANSRNSGWNKGRGGSSVNQRGQGTNTVVKPGGTPGTSGTCVLVSRSRFMVDIGYHAKLIEIFKSLSSKSYDANTKKWSFSLAEYDELMEAVKVLKGEVEVKPLSTSVCLAFRSQLRGQTTSLEVPEASLDLVDLKLVQALMPFQRKGVDFAIHRNGRALIADEMGLGKTIQAICVACHYRTEWPMLVVTPSSMRYSWAEAFLKWIPSLEEHEINVVTSGKEDVACGLINIISYDIMSRQTKALLAKRFKVVIMDESHFLKNYKTARTKAALPLLKAAYRVILLSGTPALSRPAELFNQVNIVNPKLFPSFHEFAVRYCDAKQNHWGWDYSGSSNLSELQLLLEEKVMVRRLKRDVLTQLPSKMRQVIMMDPGVVKTGSMSLKSAAKEMEKKKSKSDQHGALLKYFGETGVAKIPALREYIIDLAECGHKFLVFAHHQAVLDAMTEALQKKNIKYIRIDGSTTSHHRKELVDKFQTNDSYLVAVLSITACNAGITLTSASTVLFAELFWNPGILVQAEDRVHRIGQQDSVTVRYLIAKGTADDYIWPLVQKKLSTLSKAGLSRDDFKEADTTEFKDPRQRSILSFFEQSFFEDDELSQEELDILDAAESTGCGSVAASNSSSEANEAETTKCSPATTNHSVTTVGKPVQPSSSNMSLFNSYSSKNAASFAPPVKKARMT
ncbi:SWI/SNF-related matrix-associated actin-dependent regulator of chromatin subfamily A-like protein 1 [Diadema setosum]|uniref:SWI/SNF-related matrix-associated actin-dependent regulator of chromatin subfamily A-like protein 1 n=1 Tax=Diadema setosum TaxID=31175 RepID=UPI003B3ABF92